MNIRIVGRSPVTGQKYLGMVVAELSDILVSGLVLHGPDHGLYLGRLGFDAEHAVRRQLLQQLVERFPGVAALGRLDKP